ncbi:hypothetical protein TWF694_009395 [Orbilia ellipsospora]|uniref:Rhodopsin domain-containing protein n=1 Tax=Orbilia ellipsospora TaxID=2528407 RepID=A0AAV9XC09_9PEZI
MQRLASANLALAGALALSGVSLNMLKYGYGKHLSDGPANTLEDRVDNISKGLIACVILYSFSLAMTKTSIIVFYNRIFSSNYWFRRSMSIILTLSWIMVFVTLMVTVFQCRPISGAWNLTIRLQPQTSCIDIIVFFYAATTINVLLDLALVFLPIVPIANLHLPTRKKFAVCLLFLVGFFSCIASIIRLVAIRLIDVTDISYSTAIPLFWSVIEIDVALICASCPAIRTLFTQHEIPFVTKFLCCGGRRGSSARVHVPRKDFEKDSENSFPLQGGYILGDASKAGRWIHSDENLRDLGASQPLRAPFQEIDLATPEQHNNNARNVNLNVVNNGRYTVPGRLVNQRQSIQYADGELDQSTYIPGWRW